MQSCLLQHPQTTDASPPWRLACLTVALSQLHSELVARGLRGTLGMAFDSDGELWGVDSGGDGAAIERPDLGGGGELSLHNPAAELNHFPSIGRGGAAGHSAPSYGYPACFTEDQMPPPLGRGRGAQWAMTASSGNASGGGGGGGSADERCQSRSALSGEQVMVPPVMALPAHSEPTGLTFFSGKACTNYSALLDGKRDFNMNGCPDSWEGDSVCDEDFEGSRCPSGSDPDCPGYVRLHRLSQTRHRMAQH